MVGVHRWAGMRLQLLCFLIIAGRIAAADPYNGFDVEGALIPADKIIQGGPPRDGIPALDNPRFVKAKLAKFMKPGYRVIGISLQGEAKAYPIPILNWHEVVNDRIANHGVVVTYCPLCGTGVVYKAGMDDRIRRFGVSGLLYNSDVLLYDRETESLWSQLMHQAVAGPLKGERLTPMPSVMTTWEEWQRQHPDSLVMSFNTGHRKDYGRDPYAAYITEPGLLFPVEAISHRYHPKERVLGLEYEGKVKAYPFVELARLGLQGEIEDSIGGRSVTVRYDSRLRSGRIFDAANRELAVVNAFWFAWYAFHPDTEVFTVEAKE